MNVTKENRAAYLSVRAKLRKALAVPGVELAAADVKSIEAVIAKLDKALAPKAQPEAETPTKAKTSAKRAVKAKAETVAKAA